MPVHPDEGCIRHPRQIAQRTKGRNPANLIPCRMHRPDRAGKSHLCTLLDHIPKQKHGLRVKHIDLFDFVMDYLKSRKLLDKAIQMQRDKGDEALKKALAGPLHESKLSAVFAEVAKPEQHDLVIVSGVGSVWPLLRSHTLLNNLQPVMGETPLVMFYPGRYDGQSLRLFGKIKSNNYYRAFKLVPQ